MPSFLVLGICFLLFSNNGEEEGWIWSLHSGFNEDDDGSNDISNFLRMTTWRIRFLNGDIKARMMLPSWNKFLRSLPRFVVVRSDHNEGLVRINLPLKSISIGFELGRFRLFFLLFSGRRMKEDSRKKMFNFAYRNVGRHSLSTSSQPVC
jgi:hypothetical protein